jgi:hypothetical protein
LSAIQILVLALVGRQGSARRLNAGDAATLAGWIAANKLLMWREFHLVGKDYCGFPAINPGIVQSRY